MSAHPQTIQIFLPSGRVAMTPRQVDACATDSTAKADFGYQLTSFPVGRLSTQSGHRACNIARFIAGTPRSAYTPSTPDELSLM